MESRRGSVAGLVGVLFLVVALVATMFLIRRPQVLENLAGSEKSVVSLVPDSLRLNPNGTLRVYLDPKGKKVVFARVVVGYDKKKIKLAADAEISGVFGNRVRTGAATLANEAGKVELVAAVKPGTNVSGPVSFATLVFAARDEDKTLTSRVQIETASSQIVTADGEVLPLSGAGLVANVTSERVAKQVSESDLGLSLYSFEQNGAKVLNVSWQEQESRGQKLSGYRVALRRATDQSLVAPEDPFVGTATNFQFPLAGVPSGRYLLTVRAMYADNVVKVQTKYLVFENGEVFVEDNGALLPGRRPVALLLNPGFEEMVNDPAKPSDLDPKGWITAEGEMEPGTGNEVSERPEFAQVLSQVNGVGPLSGKRMLKNHTEFLLKSHVRQSYLQAVRDGVLVQKLAVFVPGQAKFLQQAEIRKAVAGEEFHVRWMDSGTNYCWRTGGGDNNPKDYCVTKGPLGTNVWHQYLILLTKQEGKVNSAGESQWKVAIFLDGKQVITSGENGAPYLSPADERFGRFFLGDECQGGGSCDGVGTMYFDNAEAYWYN
ncbi:MAG: hypothetical protein UY21_C0007G0024 [Microgenomates group bacterium GW2011_GWA1_48_10]|uniref:Cohesin domain-containing protein n=1 Tax=Candidatus Gottesmanbacteria bacterium RIFCSPHIGHO2_01_FULL_47_48 TaxID=1798381 RepID=A0A1F6A2S7_9BACT|nr:MAG: hypothetical protein UY21_C0007G0024 [Microgenomates group bacterium GW2011_GWA1_48_10]OGG18969.1 MAG: hypothetical protein A2721_02410 [Candidatus Gottesmanbacteria bacterium RIFCSPHIGHO2_01_FULL_47_48]